MWNWRKKNEKIYFGIFFLAFFLNSCPFTGNVPWSMPGPFVAIDIREDGACSFPLLITIEGEIGHSYTSVIQPHVILYNNPVVGIFGNNEEGMDPPLFGTGMVQNCRLYIMAVGRTMEDNPEMKVHVKNLRTGKEGHITFNFLDYRESVYDYPGCTGYFTSDDDGWKEFVKCGKSLSEVSHFTMELETPTTAFSWQDILESVELYTCEQN
jgi:hypothetical protein